jgi:flagellar basal-body rod protein FlgB
MDSKIAQFMFDKTGVSKVGKYLDVASFRHKLIAGNLSNISTPGYRSRDIDFQTEFNRAVGQPSGLVGTTTDPDHIPIGEHAARDPEVHQAELTGDELNAVDIDQEVSKMAQNELVYTVGARLLKKKFDGLRKAITNGQ